MLIAFTEEELILIKEITNVFGGFVENSKEHEEAYLETAGNIWTKLNDANVPDVYDELCLEDVFSKYNKIPEQKENLIKLLNKTIKELQKV